MNVCHILFALTVKFSALRFKGRGKTDFKGYLKVVFFKTYVFQTKLGDFKTYMNLLLVTVQ